MSTQERLFGFSHAFDHPVTIALVAMIALGLVTASTLIRVLRIKQIVSPKTFQELLHRTRSWYVLSLFMIAPVLLGAFWVWLFFLLLSLFCYREFARVTQLNHSRSAMVSVIIAILAAYFATLDHWMNFFDSATALGIVLIAIIGLIPDQPKGYIHRISLAIIGFSLFGVSLNHVAYLGNDTLFRPIILWILFCTELNDVFAYLSGKTFGRKKLIPNTSPNKTVAGAVGAVLLTTTVSTVVSHFIFRGTELGHPVHLIAMGLLISVLGQCGDLVVSSLKRDIGIKDMADTIPGHGGLLDRFDSLLLVAPILFHYLNYFKSGGIGSDQMTRIFSS